MLAMTGGNERRRGIIGGIFCKSARPRWDACLTNSVVYGIIKEKWFSVEKSVKNRRENWWKKG